MNYPIQKRIGLVLGPLLCIIILCVPTQISVVADTVIGVAVWMVIWWVTEAVSISVTALLPLALFPVLGVLDIKGVAQHYGSSTVFLFFGGFIMALALEKVQLHKRIALTIIHRTGTSPNRVILGFMIATAFLSMWISNTACTVVMLPMALSVVTLLSTDDDGYTKGEQRFALSLMLGIAFAANVGGMATIIGTPPNLVLVGFLETEYQTEVSFVNWLLMALPITILMLTVIYWVLVKWVYPNRLQQNEASATVIAKEMNTLGKVSNAEWRVLCIFCIVIGLWIFRKPINTWSGVLQLSDTGISILGALAFFVLPIRNQKERFILDWKDTQRLPWGILILFGGGLALANGLASAGIIKIVTQAIATAQGFSILLIVSLLITVMLFMTELMSNVALVTIFVPVVAGIAIGLELPMLHLLIPVTLAASCAFMLPMATPPNAIVFASGHIKVAEMVKAGVILNSIAVVVLILVFQYYIPLFFH